MAHRRRTPNEIPIILKSWKSDTQLVEGFEFDRAVAVAVLLLAMVLVGSVEEMI